VDLAIVNVSVHRSGESQRRGKRQIDMLTMWLKHLMPALTPCGKICCKHAGAEAIICKFLQVRQRQNIPIF
jgi:hypothetical protein